MRFFLHAALLAGLTSLFACGDDTSATGAGGAGGTPSSGGGGQGEGGGGGSEPLTGEPVKILNWNLHNFFDTVEDTSNTEDDSVSQAEYSEKLNAIVDILAELDPDIMVLQEVENETILEDLNAALGDKYPQQHILQGHDPRGVDIAAMSKIQFDDVVSHLGDSFVVEGTTAPEFTFTRDLLEYHFHVGEQKVVLLGVHLKAKGPPDNPDKRLAEAQRARAVADGLTADDPELAVVVLGDFNDLPDSPPLDAVVGSDPTYESIASNVDEGDRWTFDFEGSLELIDHQMANPVMAKRVDTESVVIRHGNDVAAASDHHPLMATYILE
ncbi:MAG: hypothetical protein HOW73_16620 [Polyangiaceae bacterium]|nr:hypothetical protein [Polyangiaceae bacterium]